ncbi:ABC transporter ATP-binding protein [Nocardioides sp. LHD-245]|uniref:ABC transporter ATP-binding protein n=1 Tax=Nocardioides sp. LHD-245 TaxID=3051387 RepID=UPI0027E19CBF|nr:ABC transporter ATP-binding protein [Nocardioides sp. LHD-245]
MDSTSPLLDLREITVRFGGIQALDQVGLTVGHGETVGLIGPNGAGKTTLFDVISGVRRPNGGTVLLDGGDVTRLSETARARRGVRRTFQRVQTFGWLSVEDNVLVPLDGRRGGGGFAGDVLSLPGRRKREQQRRALVAEVLERCGLAAYAGEQASSLPIGIARMVELARAIAEPPRLLLLDEPASGLDDGEATVLAALLADLRATSGCSVLLVEHDTDFVMRHSDRIVVLHQGSVLAEGTPARIQAEPSVRAAYLGGAPDRDGARSA